MVFFWRPLFIGSLCFLMPFFLQAKVLVKAYFFELGDVPELKYSRLKGENINPASEKKHQKGQEREVLEKKQNLSYLFPQGVQKKASVLTWVKEEIKNSSSERVIQTRFESPQGKTLVKTLSQFIKGNLKSFQVEQMQTQEKGRIEIKDQKVLFTYVRKGEKKQDEEDLEKNFVVPSTLVSFIQKNWLSLMKGESLKIRLGVWYRLETVGFKIFKERQFQEGGLEQVEIKMKPSSFIIAALVDPLYFRFTKDGKQILRMKGRIAVKKKVKSQWKDWDAEGVYVHK